MKSRKLRRLSAVMFADIVGYTALVQRDENHASRIRSRHRAVFMEEHKIFRGRIIQYYGDGVLSVFQSAVDAVECAIAIQRAFRENIAVPLRIGLHMGDIVFDKTEVFGDGVNVAARIESLGIAGSILLSAKLNEELKNHTGIHTISIGKFELKNILQPVEVFAVSGEGLLIPPEVESQAKNDVTAKTIAVLPFVNMSSNEDNEFFSDGITEEIIGALSKIKNLQVTSRTSSFFFKNKNIPIRQIGKELNVSTILEGSVRLSGNMVRITAQLISVETDSHFWSSAWDRKLENIFEIQDEISLLIAGKLREHVGYFEIQQQLVHKPTNNFTAYELFLKARYLFRKWNPVDVKSAIHYYEQSLKLDPDFAESIFGLADCYGFLGTTGFMPIGEAWSTAAELTYKGLALNDRLANGYYQLANLQFFTKCNFPAALEAIIKAIDLNPNYVEAQQYCSFLNIMVGEKSRARHHLKIALSIDPLSPETKFFHAYFDYMMGDYTSSLEKLNWCLEQNEKNIPAHTVKCYCLLKLGRYDAVLDYFDTLPSDILVPGEKLGITALAYALKKDTINTADRLKDLIELDATEEGFRTSSFLLLLYAVTGKNDLAFEWIKKALEIKSPLLLLHFVDPLIEPLKSDPRYNEYKKIIFPESREIEIEIAPAIMSI